MNFYEDIHEISNNFKTICDQHKMCFDSLSIESINFKDFVISDFNFIKDLYRQERNIRLKDTLNYSNTLEQLKAVEINCQNRTFNNINVIFKNRFLAHIKYNIDLIECCLLKIKEYEGKLVSTDQKILYLLNYCIILDRTSYFQEEFINRLDELNNELIGINNLSFDVYFRIGALNFKRHSYQAAIMHLIQANVILDTILQKNDFANLIEKAKMLQILFKSKMLHIVSLEFQGKFEEAIELLIGKSASSLIDAITITDLIYLIGDEETETKVIDKTYSIVNTLLNNDSITSFIIFAQKTDIFFKSLSSIQQQELKYYDDEFTFSNDYVHEALHVLAHCLNELGVKNNARDFNQRITTSNNDMESKTHSYIIFSRALMLMVAKKHDFMKNCNKCLTCLSTIFAEIGDYASSLKQLELNIKTEYYKTKGILARAEIDFFYYLIYTMSNPDLLDVSKSEQSDLDVNRFYESYVNCCYSVFDYDALSQIEMYRFKYKVAVALLKRNTQDIKKELEKLIAEFEVFLCSSQSVYINNWTKNEYNKISIMFQFLLSFYNITPTTINNLHICDLAKKYLTYFARSERLESYINFDSFPKEDVQGILKFIETIFPKSTQEYGISGIIQIRNCIYVSGSSSDNTLKGKLNPHNVYFIVGKAPGTKKPYTKFFNDELIALKQYFIFCAFDSIVFDFLNPKSIFILVPFVGAEPLKYQLNSFDTLTTSIVPDIIPQTNDTYDFNPKQKDTIIAQFRRHYLPEKDEGNWHSEIYQKATNHVFIVLWNKEDAFDSSTHNRFFMSSNNSATNVYPLINHEGFINLLDRITNQDADKPLHPPSFCRLRETADIASHCVKYGNIDKTGFSDLYKHFCLGIFSNLRLQDYTILVKYEDSPVRYWRILVLHKDFIKEGDISTIQGILCDNYVQQCQWLG